MRQLDQDEIQNVSGGGLITPERLKEAAKAVARAALEAAKEALDNLSKPTIGG